MTASRSRDETSTIDASARSVDLRIAIADHFGFGADFRERVQQSNSNSLAAIEFVSGHLEAIAAGLGIEDAASRTVPEKLAAIREVIGSDREVERLDWIELRDLALAADVNVDGDGSRSDADRCGGDGGAGADSGGSRSDRTDRVSGPTWKDLHSLEGGGRGA